jgi:drug/metabolite transporter (DMT)-like permease
MLFLYAVAFSFAYVSLNAGAGALILFGSVQATMITAGLIKGERPPALAWCGLVIALAGLVYLVFPGIAAPSFSGAALMALAGFAWGVYSLRGLGSSDPVAITGGNFLRSVPMTAVASLVLISSLELSWKGVLLASLSGGLTSGIGYVVWYAALRTLSATRAAMLQLLVPIIAAVGGVLLLSELITLRLILAAILIIGGVGLTLGTKQQ